MCYHRTIAFIKHVEPFSQPIHLMRTHVHVICVIVSLFVHTGGIVLQGILITNHSLSQCIVMT